MVGRPALGAHLVSSASVTPAIIASLGTLTPWHSPMPILLGQSAVSDSARTAIPPSRLPGLPPQTSLRGSKTSAWMCPLENSQRTADSVSCGVTRVAVHAWHSHPKVCRERSRMRGVQNTLQPKKLARSFPATRALQVSSSSQVAARSPLGGPASASVTEPTGLPLSGGTQGLAVPDTPCWPHL